MLQQLLGGLTADQFLERHWQKEPLLVRGAIPSFNGLLERDELFELACNGEAESRLVYPHRGRWNLRNGPLAAADFQRRKGPWTILVQGLNHHLPEADALLRRFGFVPFARLDDLMVSYAAKGGGVGPHFDSYDVFLIQGTGQRLWQVSDQDDLEILPDIPLRILKNFKITQEWTLDPGDMLYLPPRYAHNGIALTDDCSTYSVGFRAPSHQELATQFLVFLEDRLEMAGMYSDPDLRACTHPAKIEHDMLDRLGQVINAIRWNQATIAEFTGCYLTEPKPHVYFDPPEEPLDEVAFAQALSHAGYRLDLRTQMLYSGAQVFINGETHTPDWKDLAALQQLADERHLPGAEIHSDRVLACLYDWYCSGFGWPGK